MDGAQYLIHTKAVAHGTNKLHNKFACMFAHDGGAKNPVFSRRCEHFDKPMILTICNSTVQVIQPLAGYPKLYALLLGLLFIQTNPRHFRIGEGGKWYDRIVHLEAPKHTKQ